jgi:hypothetical protein
MTGFRATTASAVLLVAAALVAGCGGGDGQSSVGSDRDRAEVGRASDEFIRSLSDRDPKGFCAAAQPSLLETVFGGRKGCLEVMSRALRGAPRVPADLGVEAVTVDGDEALVTFDKDPPGEIEFVREEGDWYVSIEGLPRQNRPGADGSGARRDP